MYKCIRRRVKVIEQFWRRFSGPCNNAGTHTHALPFATGRVYLHTYQGRPLGGNSRAQGLSHNPSLLSADCHSLPLTAACLLACPTPTPRDRQTPIVLFLLFFFFYTSYECFSPYTLTHTHIYSTLYTDKVIVYVYNTSIRGVQTGTHNGRLKCPVPFPRRSPRASCTTGSQRGEKRASNILLPLGLELYCPRRWRRPFFLVYAIIAAVANVSVGSTLEKPFFLLNHPLPSERLSG